MFCGFGSSPFGGRQGLGAWFIGVAVVSPHPSPPQGGRKYYRKMSYSGRFFGLKAIKQGQKPDSSRSRQGWGMLAAALLG
jgi:hypothetical protein